MIEVRVWEDIVTGDRHFEGKVSAKDLRDIKLDDIDRMTLSQPEENAADIFQSLQILAFRQQQHLTEVESKTFKEEV